jgi:predicted O-methyltransferase YrrM
MAAEPFFEQICPDLTEDQHILQIGAFTGDATRWLLDNTKAQITDVDTWAGSDEEAHDAMDFSDVESVYDAKVGSDPRVTKLKMTSDEFFLTNIQQFDFIYVDGDHTASQVAIDGINAFRFLKVGGTIAFDDLDWQSGKGAFYDPKLGIEAFNHIVQGQVEPLCGKFQAWFRKREISV